VLHGLTEFKEHLYFFSLDESTKLFRYGAPSTITAIETNPTMERLRFSFPNPSKGKINLTQQVASASLSDMLGREESFYNTMEVQTTMRGVCILKIITMQGDCVIEKVVIE
jgi:hypothetical protein